MFKLITGLFYTWIFYENHFFQVCLNYFFHPVVYMLTVFKKLKNQMKPFICWYYTQNIAGTTEIYFSFFFKFSYIFINLKKNEIKLYQKQY